MVPGFVRLRRRFNREGIWVRVRWDGMVVRVFIKTGIGK